MKPLAILGLILTLSVSYPVLAASDKDVCPSADLVKQTQFSASQVESAYAPSHYNVLSQFIDSTDKVWNVKVLDIWADTPDQARDDAKQTFPTLSFRYVAHQGPRLECHYLTGDYILGLKYLLGYDVVASPSA